MTSLPLFYLVVMAAATGSRNPAVRAVQQGEPSGATDWDNAFRRIMALTSQNPQRFRAQPQANRFEAILEAFVPSRSNPTHVKVLALVNALVQNKAIRADEAGLMYNAMLQRVARYNSTNTQENLSRLVQDVREAVATKERSVQEPSLASLVALNAFYAQLPAQVPRGQSDYLAFLSALKLLVSEVPQTDVYRTGPNTFFSTSRHGQQTVNLTAAFKNLEPLWGVKAPVSERAAISSILTPNTRLLLLIVAPFTESANFNRDTYIGHLLTLYRETIGDARADEVTFNEITSVSRALGQEDTQNLTATLNFLLTNKPKRVPRQFSLSEEEERVVRYVQQSVALFLMQDGVTPSRALDLTSENMSPSFYAAHREFINRLLDYLRRALTVSPNYFTNIIMNAAWYPPEGFYTGEFDFPEEEQNFVWDEFHSDEFSSTPSVLQRLKDDMMDEDLPEGSDEPRSLSELGAAAPRPRSAASSRTSWNSLFRRSPTPTSYLRRFSRTFRDKVKNETEIDTLSSMLDQRWTTFNERATRYRLPKKDENSDDDSLSGTGLNPFLHLKPKGLH